MSPKHHPSDALLVSHAGGGLGEGLALALAAHLAFCPMCRERLRVAEAAGGALLEDMAPVAMREDSLDRAMAMVAGLEAPVARRGHMSRTSAIGSELPEPVATYLDDSSGRSWRWLAPGIRQIELHPRTAAGGSARLLRIAPGCTLPHHGHSGIELTLVLKGSFTDETGCFGPGDLAELDEETKHQPISDSHEDCFCLIATEAPLRFTSLVGRILQPIVKL